MGYHKRSRRKTRHFVMLETSVLSSPECKGLTNSEFRVYVYIKKNYNGGNNGTIPLSYSELKGVMAPATLSKALKGLLGKGWIEKTQHGGLHRYYCHYKLTGRYDEIS